MKERRAILEIRITRRISARTELGVDALNEDEQPFDHVIAFSDDTGPGDAWKSQKSTMTVQPSQAFCYKGIQ